MRSFTAAAAKNKFGELVDMARSAPVAITKYDRTVLVIMAVEEYERLAKLDAAHGPSASPIDDLDQ
ncbi:MAG: type II toxin-antitoxin system prevent-host-death family antitoxin [Alphaproteobacteria bacterium PA3]|nr:MAG: type II toxin-antitoxin system prevent-host-death family antitoxin [Alphaproteobacteria bacterium PA3]